MKPESQSGKKIYNKHGFFVQEIEQQAINYLIDSDAQQQRLQCWRKLLSQLKQLRQGEKQSIRKLKNQVRKGVQDSLRHLVWPQLIYKPVQSFQECINKGDLKEINLDLDRTFPTHKQAKFIGQKMKIVLNAIAYAFPKVGYCQGMNFIVGTLLLKLSNEQTFNVACHIIHWERHEQLLISLDLIHQKLYALDKLISKKYPQLFKHLKEHEIQTTLFASSWFITLFCNTLPASYTFRILQCFIMQGEKVIYRAALQILKAKKHALKSLHQVQKVIEELKNFDQFLEINIDAFFDEMYKLNLSRKDINSYISEFRQNQSKKKIQ